MIKRKIFIINPKFQYKLSLLITLLLLVCSSFYPYILHKQVSDNIKLAAYTSEVCSSQLSPSFVLENSPEKIERKRKDLIYIISLMQIALCLIIFVYFIFISHRIAGPIYKAQKYLSYIKEGGKHDKIKFRDSDYFPELATSINETFDALVEKNRKDFMYLSEVNSYLKNLLTVLPEDKKAVVLEITENLEKIQSKFSE